jgi:CheY-like chemotaxis protein/two-component sensor histidine kinase
LVDDLLDVSRITRGKVELRLEELDLIEVIVRAVETVRPLIDSRKHRLTVSQPGRPIRVQGDPTRLAQVIGNLLNNAAKYTEEGGQITVCLEREGDEAVLRIRDTGAGISAEMLPKVFDLFIQVDRTIDRSQGGLGVGLTLVRSLVEMHGGSTQAFSAGVGKGSEFVVRLPALAEDTGRKAPRDASIEGAPRRNYRVLIVDDNLDAGESLAMLLRLAGDEVRTAISGTRALEVAEAFRPQVVLLDIGLPGMDGYEVARRLRQLGGGDEMRLIAVTGYGQEDDRRRSREAGLDHHLVKPADPDIVEKLLADIAVL